MENVVKKDGGCGREGWRMWQRRMWDVAEEDGEYGREGWGMWQRRNVAEN